MKLQDVDTDYFLRHKILYTDPKMRGQRRTMVEVGQSGIWVVSGTCFRYGLFLRMSIL